MTTEINENNDLILKNLKSWVKKAGGSVHSSLVLKSGENQRGLFAGQSISKGEALIRLPTSLAISGEKLPSKFQQRNASPWLRCLACLYLCQNDDEEWEAYLQSLPSAGYETLWQWTDPQASFLTGTTLGATLKADRDEGATQSRYKEYVQPYLKHLKIPIAKETKKAMQLFETISMCLSTRGFHMQPEEEAEPSNKSTAGPYLGPFLLPVIDLLNHTDDPQLKATTLQRDRQAFYMRAERDIEQGEELLHSYGDNLTAAQLLQTFGFVPRTRMVESHHDLPKTPAILSAQTLIEACTFVKQSNYPKELQTLIEENDDQEREAFELPTSTQTRDVSWLPDQLVVDSALLTDELVTLCAIQILPDEVYQEVGQDLLQPEILEDYFLGKLVARALLNAIQTKLDSYTPLAIIGTSTTTKDDKTLLPELLQQSSKDTATQRALYAVTIRLEEKSALEALRKEVLALVASLEDDDEDDDDNALEELLRQRMEQGKDSKPPAQKKAKKSNE